MDESGLLSITNSEALFEVEYEEVVDGDQYENLSEAVGDAIAKFGSKISQLFSGSEDVSTIFACAQLHLFFHTHS